MLAQDPALSPGLQTAELSKLFQRDGYVLLPGIVPAAKLAQLARELLEEFALAKSAGKLSSVGGAISGHLNCFPGAQSRFVYEALSEHGVIELIRQFSPKPLRQPNIGCNMNLIGSGAQNCHVDGYADATFMIANVAVVDTTLENGAMEATPGSHQREYKYHQFMLARRPAARMQMKAGDVLVRTSSLWHRGMPNRSQAIRPMLGFTWEYGGSEYEDPYCVHGGKITFLPNRYTGDLAGRLRERAFAAAPFLGSAYLFLRSLLTK